MHDGICFHLTSGFRNLAGKGHHLQLVYLQIEMSEMDSTLSQTINPDEITDSQEMQEHIGYEIQRVSLSHFSACMACFP